MARVPLNQTYFKGAVGAGVETEAIVGSRSQRRGNVLEITHTDSRDVERTIRFIGAERQPIAGLRRLAYIPSGETPAESHFLAAAKSSSSTSEILPTDGISGVIGYHLAVWYEAALPQFDLFTCDYCMRHGRSTISLRLPTFSARGLAAPSLVENLASRRSIFPGNILRQRKTCLR